MSFEDLKKLIDQQTKILLENRAQERLGGCHTDERGSGAHEEEAG